MREDQGNGYVVTETRVSPHGHVALQVVRPDGVKVTVQLPKGTDTPEAIAELADHAAAPAMGRGEPR